MAGSGCDLTEEMSLYFLAVTEENDENLSHDNRCPEKEIRNDHSRIQAYSVTPKLTRDPQLSMYTVSVCVSVILFRCHRSVYEK